MMGAQKIDVMGATQVLAFLKGIDSVLKIFDFSVPDTVSPQCERALKTTGTSTGKKRLGSGRSTSGSTYRDGC